MAPFLFDVRDGVHVFDLAKTRECFLLALDVLISFKKENKSILFVGTKKQVKDLVAKTASKTNTLYVNERWMGGTLTNFDQILRRIKKLAEMKDKTSKGEYSHFTKKERLLIERKIEDLEKDFGGLTNMTKLPDLLVIIDIHKEVSAVREARQLGIPTIGIVDSNSNPTDVTYPIPMNDDASKALEYVMNLFESALADVKVKEVKPKKAKKVKVDKKAAEAEILPIE